MLRNKKIICVGMLVVILSSLCGCNMVNTTENKKKAEGTNAEAAFLSMEEEAVLEYEIPKSTPHILVNQLAYDTEGTKEVMFFGESLPRTFSLVNANTKESVYTNFLVDKGRNEEYDTNIAVGDFSDFTVEGDYYIIADYLGSSYVFSIKSAPYDDVFKETCRTYYYNRCGITLTENLAGSNAHNACHTGKSVLRDDITVSLDVTGGWHQDGTGSKDVVAAAATMGDMLLAYEIYPESFKDDTNIPESYNTIPDILDELKYETLWLLKMQDSDTGAVYSAVTVAEGENKSAVSYIESPTTESARAFAFALAKFSFLYQKFDKDYATTCLQAADRAWKYANLNEIKELEDSKAADGEELDAWKMAAAAELYRASGVKDYENYLNEFFANPANYKKMDSVLFAGCSTYLNTKQKINKDYCNSIIKVIMESAEEISRQSRISPFMVPADTEQQNNGELLEKMVILSFVDYIITNHEYDMIIENYLHYFLGRNYLSITYLDNVGTNNYIDIHPSLGPMKQFDQNGKLIFMLSKIVNI